MSEPQYQSYFNAEPEVMGPMAAQYYRDDPKLLGIHLARYKFVSKMLAGKEKVAEVGCGDGWFSRIVQREVGTLHMYDFDKRFIDSIYARKAGKAYAHDMLDGKLEYGAYDAVYSLDCLEHVAPNKQKKFMENVCDSLRADGCFIVGMPSAESQKYASPASKKGHVGCLGGDETRAFLGNYFANVFLFSMNDETLHTGFYPMAHYLMAVCTNVR